MSIKENQLPTAQEVTENNLIRTIDENGASQNMTVDQLGGLVGGDGGGATEVILRRTYDGGYIYTSEATWQELYDYFQNGLVYFRLHFEDVSNVSAQVAMIWRVYFDGTHYIVVSNIDGPQYTIDLKCNNTNGYPSVQID